MARHMALSNTIIHEFESELNDVLAFLVNRLGINIRAFALFTCR